MPGSASFDPPPIPLDGDAAEITVARWNGLRPVYLPNVTCEAIQIRSGAEPRAARFRYVLDDTGAYGEGMPTSFAQIIPDSASGMYVVKNDDELLVFRELGDDEREVLFHGFARIPQADLSPDAQAVTFQAIGAEVRAWDTPISFATYRDGDDPEDGELFDLELPARFNPDGKPNCTPDGHDYSPSGTPGASGNYPVFLDWRLVGSPAPQTPWTLGKAVRYLIGYNDEEWVTNPDTTGIDAQLQAIKPIGDGAIDPSDPATFDAEDIIIREYDATGKRWPEAIQELIGAYGFQFDFTLDPEWVGDRPRTSYRFSRLDGLFCPEPKTLKLQPPGTTELDPGKSNVGGLRVTRDNSAIANRIEVETKPNRYEISIVLAPGFEPASGDAAAREPFKKSKLTDATRNKYRLYIADECGDGHWDTRGGTWVTDPGYLGAVELDEDGERYWVRRYRPALGSLLSKDPAGRRRQVELHVSTDYGGKVAEPWDGTGTWQKITSNFRVLSDRLGIYFEVEDPEDIRTGASGAAAKGGTLRGISASAIPDGTNYKKFYLRLTCAVEGDDQIEATAEKRPASPSKFEITQRIDAADHFAREGIAKNTPYFPAGATGNVSWVRDDEKAAQAYARAVQSAREAGKFAGSAEIPRVVVAYEIGDRIEKIDGINMSMRVNSGGSDEGAQYPVIVGLDWTFGARQSTTLQLADRRAEPYRLF